MKQKGIILPLIPLRELVTFPSSIVPVLVGREKSINALKYSRKYYNNFVVLSVQKNQITENPAVNEIAEIGIIARVERSAEQENGSYRIIIHGLERARIERFLETDLYFLVSVSAMEEIFEKGRDFSEIGKELIIIFDEYASAKKVKLHGVVSRLEVNRISEITDIIASVLMVPLPLKQSFLEEVNVYKRAVKLYNILKKEMSRLRDGADENGRRARDEGAENEIDDYRKKIESAHLPDHVKARAQEEMGRLRLMPPFSAESTVSRTYLDWLLAVPWTQVKEENRDLKRAARILDEDHFGLEKAKDRILDYLAVRRLVNRPLGEILCFVGPPGVGKSSLSRSIARALDRAFVRVSLGGVRDEAEIRGHRRTYVGSYPGQIIKELKKAKSKNPVFLLDEIDKLNADFRGDPASALLEVLDPEQNMEFVDHYLDLELDLSQVFFITTANSMDPIPPALRDRMEIIEIPSYTEREKLSIARNFLLKKQAEKNGIRGEDVELSDEVISDIINRYTREAGVRNLERQVAILMRKVARHFIDAADGSQKPFMITAPMIEKYLGIPKYSRRKVLEKSDVGVSVGLAWTMAGGDILIIESRCVKGKGDLILTGSLGDVMKESSSTAFSYSKIKLSQLDLDTNEVEGYNIHLHIPEGAVPKEGPSAGVTLAVSIISLLTGIPVKANHAMTGEITLRGRILPVGGIKEKIIAAHRYGISNVLIPGENEKEFQEEVPDDIKASMRIHLVDTMDQLLEIVLEKPIKIKNINSKIIRPFLNAELQ
ncbi:MAG: endopeptidase La [Candidatus Omnitrophota bacterium]